LSNVSAPRPEKLAGASARSSTSEFGRLYQENIAAVSGFFARRCTEPQTVADLTSETFVAAISSFHSFDAGRGSPRAWLIGIARVVYARHYAGVAGGRQAINRLAGQMTLDADEIDDLAARVDAQRSGRELLMRAGRPELERTAIELVDLIGLTPKEAARTLHISPGALRVRLFRARARLRKEAIDEHV
jgi:RNA polymerase sigma factor (sigma-70 family)